MSEPKLQPENLVRRIDRLERRQRFLSPLAGLAVVVMVAAVVGFVTRPADVVQAQRVELVNLKGEVLATWTADTNGILLTLIEKGGRAGASFRLNRDPRLTVLDGAGREVAGIGAPRVQHLVNEVGRTTDPR